MRIETRSTQGGITIEDRDGGISIKSPYNPDFVAALKSAVPYNQRTWSKPYWIVDRRHISTLQQLVKDYYGAIVVITESTPGMPLIETKVFQAQYVGACKDRPLTSEPSALALIDTNWSLVLPESVLRAFFAQNGGSDKESYYDVLCVAQSASAIEIKSAYRRIAKQWHPDRCKEPGAIEIFKNIGEAYDLLSNPLKRKKYNAALKFEGDHNRNERSTALNNNHLYHQHGYRSPLRCGMIVCEGQYHIGKFIASAILAWSDITDDQGRTMISSWSTDLESVVIEWV